jgi:HAD superfamily hydrolase (TIGR01509 family)
MALKTILIDAVDTFVIEGQGVFEEMHALLETYPNHKIIVTNANDEQFIEFGLDRMPYEVFTLKHNPDKPDPVYFTILLAHLGLVAGDVVYFEHNPAAIESARSVGIVSYHYNHEQKDLGALKEWLDASI